MVADRKRQILRAHAPPTQARWLRLEPRNASQEIFDLAKVQIAAKVRTLRPQMPKSVWAR